MKEHAEKKTKLENEQLLEIIKTAWADIHHTRNQEWTSLAMIGGIIYALFQVKDSNLQTAITIFGLIACILSILMVVRHWLLFKSKIKIIITLHEKMGISIKMPESKIPVQGIIAFFYFLLCSALLGWLTWLLFQNIFTSIISSVAVLIFGLLFCIIIKKAVEKKVKAEVSVTVS